MLDFERNSSLFRVRGEHATARVHHDTRWCGGYVARGSLRSSRTGPAGSVSSSPSERRPSMSPPLRHSNRSWARLAGSRVTIFGLTIAGPLEAQRAHAPPPTRSLALNPDVILGQSAAVVEALLSTTRTTPIVFLHVADPVAYGFVSNLARPGGNVTGITNIEPSIGGKWLQLLKEMAPAVTRAALLVNPDTQPDRGAIFINPFEAAARSLGVTSVKGERARSPEY